MDAVVVIGDGPSPEGMRWGKEIDRQDRVVRLWNHQWQRVEDYGTRYDHGLITLINDPWRVENRPVPAVSWFFYNGANEPKHPFLDGKAVDHFDHKTWLRRAIAMGAAPARNRPIKLTRGFVAAAGAIERLRPRRIVMVGMDMMRDCATTSPRYGAAAAEYRAIAYPGRALEELPAGSPREGHHDHAVEGALIREMAAAAGTEIAWGF